MAGTAITTDASQETIEQVFNRHTDPDTAQPLIRAAQIRHQLPKLQDTLSIGAANSPTAAAAYRATLGTFEATSAAAWHVMWDFATEHDIDCAELYRFLLQAYVLQ